MRPSSRSAPAHRRAAVLAALVLLASVLVAAPARSQEGPEDNRVWGANRALAARFTQAKLDQMLFDTRVQPHWLEGSDDDRFWYTWEDSTGKTFWLVDPLRGTRDPIFDNADIAAQLTVLTRDPYDAQHLPIDKIRWVKDNTAIQFDVVSSQDEEKERTEGDTQENEEGRRRRG